MNFFLIISSFRLTIECHDDEGMRYRSAMSDLLQAEGQVKPYYFSVENSLIFCLESFINLFFHFNCSSRSKDYQYLYFR